MNLIPVGYGPDSTGTYGVHALRFVKARLREKVKQRVTKIRLQCSVGG